MTLADRFVLRTRFGEFDSRVTLAEKVHGFRAAWATGIAVTRVFRNVPVML